MYKNNKYFINIENFNLSYGEVNIFNNFNFSVEKGQIIGIAGPTGSGKTSLLNKIAEDYISRYKISFVFQDNKLILGQSVYKNVILPLENKKLDYLGKKSIENKVNNILEKVNLIAKKNKKSAVLSGGEKQRVNLARAFAYPCEILLMDEPFSAQDEENRENLIKYTKEFAKENNVTVVIVSHNREDLEKLADKVIIL